MEKIISKTDQVLITEKAGEKIHRYNTYFAKTKTEHCPQGTILIPHVDGNNEISCYIPLLVGEIIGLDTKGILNKELYEPIDMMYKKEELEMILRLR